MQKLQPYLKYLKKYLYVPGVFLAVAGTVAGATTGQWSPLYVGLMVAGSVLILGWLIWTIVQTPSLVTRRSTQAGTNAFLATAALLVIVGVINFLAFRYFGRIDLTENQLYTLSPQTQEIVTNLKQPMKLWVFDSNPNPSDKDLLENYRRYNQKFSFEFVNPDQRPGLVKTFQVKSQGDVYLESGEKRQLVQTLINFNQREPLSEIRLTNAIEKLLRDRVLNVYFLQGHGESPLNTTKEGLSEAVSSLENKGFKVNPLNLVETAGIPDNTNTLILAGPKRKLFAQEVTALQNYLNRGGSLFVMADPETDPGLDPILKPWGVQLDPRIILDVSGAGSLLGLGPAAPIITTYGEHPITKEFGNGMSIFPLSRPISTVKTPNVQAVTILEASDKMWAKKELTAEELTFDPEVDLNGPFDLGVALTRTIDPNQKPTPSPSPASTASPNPSPSPRPSPSSPISPSPSPTPQPSATPKTTSLKDAPSSVKLVSYSVAQQNPQSSPKPTISPSPSPTPQLSPSAPISPTLSPTPQSSPSPATSPATTPQAGKVTSKMVVIGNSAFATNQWFGEQLNGDVFLNSVQWLATKDEQTLSIRPKEPKKRRIILNTVQASLISWLSLVIFPLIGLGLAISTWWRRR
ncbi:MAG: Gldg family protein [Snowella sp.]|nr:Gldg family protein [Snowella sp.]